MILSVSKTSQEYYEALEKDGQKFIRGNQAMEHEREDGTRMKRIRWKTNETKLVHDWLERS